MNTQGLTGVLEEDPPMPEVRVDRHGWTVLSSERRMSNEERMSLVDRILNRGNSCPSPGLDDD